MVRLVSAGVAGLGLLVSGLSVFGQAPAAGQPPPTAQERPGQASATTSPVPPPASPEVHADGTVTFRFQNSSAMAVQLSLEGWDPLPMEKGTDGIWTVTTTALTPDDYGYHFIADGVGYYDPNNTSIKVNLLFIDNLVHVPVAAGAPPNSWDSTDVPHGEVHHHFYKSGVVGDERDFFVYTPPGYDPAAKKKYPVLYLLHGYSDKASGWTAVGYANRILDNLIAQGKAKPMLVVMPLGYGAPEIVERHSAAFRDAGLVERNMANFRKTLLTEVLPQVEKEYHVSADRKDRAIAGLSMGGAESLYTGLNEIDTFGYVGAFSAGGLGENYDKTFAALDAKSAARLKTLWIACGTEDRLITPNRAFIAWLKSKGIEATAMETSGRHTWMVWRRNLTTFAPLLFQDK
jgi:enterochelin esterase-like enzyme